MANNSFEVNDLYYEGKVSSFFKVVSSESDGHVFSSVVDKFGNIVSPFFDGKPSVVVYATNKCFVVGNEKGKNNTYDITFNGTLDGTKCKKVKFASEVSGVRYVNPDRLLINSSLGSCFVSPSYSFRPVSDYYDAIYFNDDWRYEKNVFSDSVKTVLMGTIDLDGKVSRLAYDTLFDKDRLLDVQQGLNGYDIIDTSSVLEDLGKFEAEMEQRRIDNLENSARRR